VSVIDAATGTVTRTMPVGFDPVAVGWRWIPLPAPSA
jgi:YVTN family beta-propeller protein